MKELRSYFAIFRGEPHFKDELNPVTHHAIELFIAEGKIVAQKTLDGREELIYTEFRTNSGADTEIKRKEPQPRRTA